MTKPYHLDLNLEMRFTQYFENCITTYIKTSKDVQGKVSAQTQKVGICNDKN